MPIEQLMKSKWGSYAILATATCLVAFWLTHFTFAESKAIEELATLLEATASGVASVLCWRAAARTRNPTWRCMAVGCALWTSGSIAWTYYVFRGDALPYPSFADIGYLLLFPPAIVSALWLHEARPRGADRARSLLDALLVAGSLTIILWWALPASAHRNNGSLELVLSVSYVAGDIVLLSLIASAIRRSERHHNELLWLLGGFAWLTVADALFAYEEARGSYLGSWIPDFSWIAGFTCIAFAATLASRAGATPRRRRRLSGEGSQYLVIYGPYLAAVAVTGYELAHNGLLIGTQGWATIALAVVAFARQIASQAENNDLTTDLEARVAELTGSHARFFAVFDESIEALALLDRDGRIRLASRQLVRLAGVSAAELVGRDALSFVCAADRDQARGLYHRTLAGEAPSPIQVRVVSSNRLVHVELTLTNLLTNPEVAGLLLGFRDISDRRGQEQQLAASQARFRAAFDHAPIGMVVIDIDLTINRLNESLIAMFAGREEDLLGRRFTDLAHPDDRPMVEQIITQNAQGESPTMDFEVRLARGDGSIIWTRMSAVTIHVIGAPNYVIAQIEDITERREIARTLEHNALHDPLTGLANRTLFKHVLAESLSGLSSHEGLAVAFVDVDRFKLVNDSLGHDAGDVLLRIIAERLLRVSRERDLVARFGGDEFILLLHDIPDASIALEITQRLEESLRQPVSIGGVDTYVTVSIGIAVAGPLPSGIHASEAADDLLRNADTAMYLAKEAGRARIEVFDKRRDPSGTKQLTIVNALHRALERDEFRLFYQPVVDVQTGEIEGFEALLRWEQKPGIFRSPVEFMGEAEDTGLIVPIGAWVLRTACGHAARWNEHAAAHGRSPVTVAVNLSPRQFDSDDIAQTVADALAATGLSSDLLWLEITESALMRDTASTTSTLHNLRRLGVHLSIDDFGTGYSSLSYLKRFPVEALKIDQSFTDGLGTDRDDTAIVTAVIGLAQALHLKVVAEGVENEFQLDQLRRLGCDGAQGYNFGQPTAHDLLGDDPQAFFRTRRELSTGAWGKLSTPGPTRPVVGNQLAP